MGILIYVFYFILSPTFLTVKLLKKVEKTHYYYAKILRAKSILVKAGFISDESFTSHCLQI